MVGQVFAVPCVEFVPFMNPSDQKPTGASRVFVVTAWLYLLLLPADIRLLGPLFAHDLLAPVFLVALVLRGNWRSWLRFPDVLLPVFLGWAGLATLVHGHGDSSPDISGIDFQREVSYKA